MSELTLSTDQQHFLSDWKQLKTQSDRDDKNVYLVKKMDAIQRKVAELPEQPLTSYERQLLELYEQEWDHQEIVIRVLRQLGNKRRHDWSKDYHYIFALAGKFKFRIPGDDFEREAQEEINRHYKLEPHHPEFEKTSGPINVLDIQEMAIDRLSRNVWANNGEIKPEQMAKYLPQFYGNQPDEKLSQFKQCIEVLETRVKDIYREVITETEQNITLRKMWAMNVNSS